MTHPTNLLLVCCLLLPSTAFAQQQQQASNLPQSNPLQDSREVRDEWRRAYKNFKPGPAVALMIERAKERQREAFHSWGAGELPQSALTVEIERASIHRHLLLCLALVAGEGGNVPELVVVQANTWEVMKVFPSGKLPVESLQPNQSYDCDQGGRKVRYLTLYQWSSGGPKFAVFAREEQ